MTTDYTALSLADVAAEFSVIARDAQTVFGLFNEHQLNWRSDQASWSVAQCFDHLLNANRENSSWGVAWLEHLPAYQQWASGDIAASIETLTPIATSLETRFSLDRETMATYSGSLWLTVGRIRQARVAFEQVGHVGQRETNLARLADLVDDKQAMIQHTKRVGWIYNPVPLARAGLFDRARRVMQQPSIGSNVAPAFAIARGLEALARNRLQDAITLLQPAVDRLRGRSDAMFYNASMSLAQAWRGAANPSQAVRVLEETVSQRPAYITPGLSGADRKSVV